METELVRKKVNEAVLECIPEDSGIYRMLSNKIQNADFKLLEYVHYVDANGVEDIRLLSVAFDFNWIEKIMVYFSGYRDILIGVNKWGI